MFIYDTIYLFLESQNFQNVNYCTGIRITQRSLSQVVIDCQYSWTEKA